MERSASIYGSSSALRGVQLKIGEKFKPPAKVTLPVGWKTRDPSRLLSFTYDFHLEEEVIEKTIAEREAREQQLQAEKLKELKNTSTASPVVANMGGDILQPTTATSTMTTTNSMNKSNDNRPFNYKDFEDNADTPFESVELQCIDNMDALKSILQPEMETDPMTSSSSGPSTQVCSNGVPIPGVSAQFNRPDVASRSLESSLPISASPEQIADQYPPMYTDDSLYAQRSQTVPENSSVLAAQNPSILDAQKPMSTDVVSVSPSSNTVSYSSMDSDRKISLPGAMRVLPPAPTRLPPRRPASVPNENMTSETMASVTQATSAGMKRPVPKPRSKLPPLRNGTNASPQIPVSNDPSPLVPPPLPPKKLVGKNRITETTHKPDVPVDDGNLKRYPSPLPPISPPKPHLDPPSFHDPTMSSEERQFVNQITSMGFPGQRVARAVKNLGCNEREVIEFLISVNEMCNLGYSEGQVEMVLKDNSDQTKAVEFLKLIVKFKELGFQEDQIFEALKKSECDSNKTLDILTCAG